MDIPRNIPLMVLLCHQDPTISKFYFIETNVSRLQQIQRKFYHAVLVKIFLACSNKFFDDGKPQVAFRMISVLDLYAVKYIEKWSQLKPSNPAPKKLSQNIKETYFENVSFEFHSSWIFWEKMFREK